MNTFCSRCHEKWAQKPIRYRNRSEITVRMTEQKPYPVWFSCLRKSYPVLCRHGLRKGGRVIRKQSC